jgi:renalase
MASRRTLGARFDHGAQHFSVRTPALASQVQQWESRGIVRRWYSAASVTFPENGVEPRWVGTPAMRSIPEVVAAELEAHGGRVVRAREVDRLVTAGREWVARDAAGDAIAAGETVVLTAPLPQALRLLARSSIELTGQERKHAESVTYDPCLVVMATLAEPPPLSDGHLAPDDATIAWIADNQHKGVSSGPAVTIHSTPDFARRHLEDDPAVWALLVRQAAEPLLGVPLLQTATHRWRYAQPVQPLSLGAMRLESEPAVILAGEALSGARVEGAYTSGLAAAGLVLG